MPWSDGGNRPDYFWRYLSWHTLFLMIASLAALALLSALLKLSARVTASTLSIPMLVLIAALAQIPALSTLPSLNNSRIKYQGGAFRLRLIL